MPGVFLAMQMPKATHIVNAMGIGHIHFDNFFVNFWVYTISIKLSKVPNNFLPSYYIGIVS